MVNLSREELPAPTALKGCTDAWVGFSSPWLFQIPTKANRCPLSSQYAAHIRRA